jgi:hypothetical protein
MKSMLFGGVRIAATREPIRLCRYLTAPRTGGGDRIQAPRPRFFETFARALNLSVDRLIRKAE